MECNCCYCGPWSLSLGQLETRLWLPLKVHWGGSNCNTGCGSCHSDTYFSDQFVLWELSLFYTSLLFTETSVQAQMPRRDFFLAPEIATTVMSSYVTKALLWETWLHSLLWWFWDFILPLTASDDPRWPCVQGLQVSASPSAAPVITAPPPSMTAGIAALGLRKAFWMVSLPAHGVALAGGAGCPKEQKILWAVSCRHSQKQQLEGIGRVQRAAESWEGENTDCGRAKKERYQGEVETMGSKGPQIGNCRRQEAAKSC